MKATITDLKHRAVSAITRKETIAYDVAAGCGQIFGNVKHMKWFVHEVAREIARTTKKYNHLLPSGD